jgi:phage terminase large subunit-like protein
LGVKSDNAAVVGVRWNKQGRKLILATHKAWRPKAQPVNLQDIEDYILKLRRRHRIVRVYADPYQAMQMLQSLQKKIGANVVQEFPQAVSNTTVMGEQLYGLIKGKNLVAYPDADMRAHVTNATGVETARGFRIAKEKASKKIVWPCRAPSRQAGTNPHTPIASATEASARRSIGCSAPPCGNRC